MKKRLTAATVKALKTEKPQLDVWDADHAAFGLRVSKTGRKVWQIMYTDRTGKRRRARIGTYPDVMLSEARSLALQGLAAATRGEDPTVAIRRRSSADETMGALLARWVEQDARFRRASWENDRSRAKRITEAFRDLPAASVTRRDVVLMLDELVHAGQWHEANQVRQIVSLAFDWAIRRGELEVNPCYRVRLDQKKPASRDRVLSLDELRAIWTGLQSMVDDPNTMIQKRWALWHQLRLCTLQRGKECLTIQPQDIECEWWTIPAKLTKSHRSSRVPILPTARAVLDQAVDVKHPRSPWIFHAARNLEKPMSIINTAQRVRLDKLTGPMDEWRPHDFRRTGATFMAAGGVDRFVIKRVLNHADPSVTGIYDRYSYDEEKVEAFKVWESALRQTR